MNKLYKSLIFNGEMSLTALETTDMVNDAIKIHKLSPLSSATLGRTLTVSTFMASGLKNEQDKLTTILNGNGVGGKVTVCGNGKLQMRGNIDNPNAYLPLKSNGKLDVGGCVGKEGRLTVIKSMGLKDPYSGSSALVSGEIAEDFASYYVNSEQIPTAIALGVKIGTNKRCIGAGGVIIQALPFCSEESIEKAEQIMGKLGALSTLIEEHNIEWVINEFFGDQSLKCELYTPEYKCLCSRKRIKDVLVSLGKEEVFSIIKEQGKIEVGCDFCNKKYIFTQEDVQKLFK